ncbi:MAG TPA: porin family protein [Flavisolibacter sp.]|jgi:hypothetical protein
MKKIIFLAVAAVVSTAAFSQVKWGVQGIGNLSSVSVKADGAEMFKKSSNIGFGVGVSSEIPLSSQVSLRPSLNLLQKGGKLKSAFDMDGGDGSMFPSIEIDNKLYYAELPVTLVYNVNLSTGKLFFGAGPSVGFGLFGKTKVTSTNPLDPSEKEEEEIDAFKKDEDGESPYKRFDLSANAIAGYQWKSGLYVNAGYSLGLSNMIESEDGESMKNRGLQLTVGFFFNKKK